MARRRDIVIAVLIGASFVLVFGWFALVFSDFAQSEPFEFSGSGNIGVVEVFGVIDESSGRRWLRQMERYAERSDIEAVILHINSPGGGTAISQELYESVLRLREQKPVVASFASVAASGGYYIACGADQIVANSGSLTGSIGVIFQYYTYAELMDKVGIDAQTIVSGEFKDVGNPSRDMTRNEELMLKSIVMDSYEQFVEAVAGGRGLDKESVYRLADGSLYTGLQAYNLGLVDTLGGLYDAAWVAMELAGMEGEPQLIRPVVRERRGLFGLAQSLLQRAHGLLDTYSISPQLEYRYRMSE